MKKILTLFAVIGLIAFSSCEGPEGPPGPEGLPGPEAEVFQVKGVNFTLSNNYNPIIPLDPNIFASDMVLVYRKAGVDNGCLLYTSPSPRDGLLSRMPSSA